jgi:hypothetical protein
LVVSFVCCLAFSGCGLSTGPSENTTSGSNAKSTATVSGTLSPAANGSGATVILSGAASASTVVDASGNYSFPALGNGSYSMTPSKSGFGFSPAVQAVTVNGANLSGINFTANAISAQSYSISGTISPTANGSGAIVTLSGAANASTVADPSGNYSFPALENGSYSVTPSKSGFGFSPNTQSANVNGANVTSVNFTASSLISAPPIPGTFFAVSDTTAGDPPKISYGVMGHPIQLVWQTSEQSKGVFDFSNTDSLASIAPTDSHGTVLIDLALGMTPPWALPITGTSTCRTDAAGSIGCTAPPDNIQDWIDFITALVNHYNGINGPHIKYYEIWNEADPNSLYWTGTAAQLAQLAAAAYPVIKQDSHSFVLTPSMAGNVYSTGPSSTVPFLTAYLAAGGNQNADIFAFHGFVAELTLVPYPLPTQDCSASDHTCGGSITAQVSAYRQVLDQNGMSGKPIFNTEGGFEGADIPDMDTKAAWLAQYYALQAGMYNSAQMQLVSWFTWGGDSELAGSLETDDHQASEVGIAYDQVFNWLVGRSFSSPCSNSGTLWTCLLTGPSGYQGEIIWDASQSCANGTCTSSNQPIVSTYVEYRDLAGNTTVISDQTVPVGLKPVLLDNQ